MKLKRLLTALTFGLALTLGLVWLLGGRPPPANAAPAQTTRYVDDATGTDIGDCSNPGSPCQTIQYAVDQAASGDEIRVASGVYVYELRAGSEVRSRKMTLLQ